MFRFLTLFLQQMRKIERVVKYSNSKAVPLTKAQGSERYPSVFLCQRKTEGFFFSSVYMRTCWVMFDSLRPYDSSQAPLSIEFSRQEYWSGLPFPSPKDLPNPGVELESPVLVGGFFTTVRSSCFLTSPISLCPGCVRPTHPMRHFPWVFCHWSCVSGW